MSSEAEPLLHTCPNCAALLDVSDQEPFSEIHCPSCNTAMRVRTRFDHFEMLEYIASGGMGTVYKARDVNLNRIVALKLLRKEFNADLDYIEKLETEAKITASVAHPCVVEVFSFGCDQGIYYIAMELVDKGSLDDLMNLQVRIAEVQVLQIGIQIAKGLRAAYHAGLIHRDVKPGNILFADAHTAKIVDFGLAMPLEQAKEGEEEIWGTPYYVAPEKLNHDPEDFRSDIYSLGGTLFHALAGRPPFEAENASLVALKHLKNQAVSLQAFAPDISSPTAYVINRTLAKSPDDRYQSYDELIEHLEYARTQLLENAGKSRQPKARVVMEDEKQQNVLGYIMVAVMAFTLVMGFLVYFFKDTILRHNTGVEELAKQQMARSYNSVEQALAAARKQIVNGDPEGAFKTLQPYEKRTNLAESIKIWIPIHESIAKIAAGQFWKANEIAAVLKNPQFTRGGDRSGNVQQQRFLVVLNDLLGTRESVLYTNLNTLNTDRFEPIGLFIAGLKEWDASRFETADIMFGKFLEAKPKGTWVWIDDFKPLAQKYRDDYATFKPLDAQIKAADTPEKRAMVVKHIPTIKAKLKVTGRLPEELAVYEKTMQSASDPTPNSGATGVVSVAVLQSRIGKLLSEMLPAEAKKEINAAQVPAKDADAKQVLLTKANYIENLKRILVDDMNQRKTTDRVLARRSGPVLAGKVKSATDSQIDIETETGVVNVPWSDVMPSSVLVWTDCLGNAMSSASSDSTRLWLGGVYACVVGNKQEGKARLLRAAELFPGYAKAIPAVE